MTMTVFSNKTVSLDGSTIGRINQDSYQMLTHIKGQTTFYTGKPGTFDKPHVIDVPLYVPATPGSVSSWNVNPEFEAAVRAVMAKA